MSIDTRKWNKHRGCCGCVVLEGLQMTSRRFCEFEFKSAKLSANLKLMSVRIQSGRASVVHHWFSILLTNQMVELVKLVVGNVWQLWAHIECSWPLWIVCFNSNLQHCTDAAAAICHTDSWQDRTACLSCDTLDCKNQSLIGKIRLASRSANPQNGYG